MKVVHKVEEGMDRTKILATTYQMRNFYRQLGDGFFGVLDIFNYIQHHQITKWCHKGDRVLDICCGRGLMLPLLRYHAKEIAEYWGVDIKKDNAIFTHNRVTDNKPIDNSLTYYPFRVEFRESNSAQMTQVLPQDYFNVLIFTSAIEHMQLEAQQQTLSEAAVVATPGATMILTCPVTDEGVNGYEAQYAAHIYEPKRSELTRMLQNSGWVIKEEYGLLCTWTDLEAELKKLGIYQTVQLLARYIPHEWLIPVFAPAFPGIAKEIGYICQLQDQQRIL